MDRHAGLDGWKTYEGECSAEVSAQDAGSSILGEQKTLEISSLQISSLKTRPFWRTCPPWLAERRQKIFTLFMLQSHQNVLMWPVCGAQAPVL
jgi:hypothetical protein